MAQMGRGPIALIVGRRGKFVVLLVWCALAVVAGPLAGKLSGAEKNEAKSWLPASAESTRALFRQDVFSSPNEIPAVVVYERKAGLTAADRAFITSNVAKFRAIAHTDAAVTGPVFSADGLAAETVVPYELGANGWKQSSHVVHRVLDIARRDPGLAVHVTGPAGYASASSDAFQGIDGTLLVAAIAVVAVILLLTYRSPVLWLLPLMSAGIALAVAEALIYLLAVHAGLTVNAQSAGILTVLVFGAGTDYALLLVARFREELRRQQDRHMAMAVALRRAGPAILASSSTVALGMLCLLVATTNATKDLGPVAAIGVVIALAAMVTLLPALLVIFGRWVFWPQRPLFGSVDPTPSGVWARAGGRISRHPRRVWITTTLVLAAMATGLVSLDAKGLTNAQAFSGRPDAVVGERVLAAHFPAGAGNPVVVLANASQAPAVRRAFASVAGIVDVTAPVVRSGEVYLQATMTAAPDSSAGYATIDRVREAVHAIPGADALVGGNTAINLDVQRAALHDRNLVIPIVLIVVLAILAMLLRALLAPVLLVATVVLSFAASLGTSALVFRHLFHYGGADTALPLYVFVFLVALGIDYNIFLMTRVREESLRTGTRPGSRTALAATGGVITSAGLVLAGTFAVLGTLPLTTFAEIGFAVAFGVLLDTTVVRSVLVTALNLDLGDAIWWPARSAKAHLPRLPKARSSSDSGDTVKLG
jgi:RND superfamily putative drug exporter